MQSRAAPNSSTDQDKAEGGDVMSHMCFSPWDSVREKLKASLGGAAFKSWLAPLTPQSFNAGTLVLGVPTRFMRDWILTHYAEKIFELCRAADSRVFAVDVVVSAAVAPVADQGSANATRSGETTFPFSDPSSKPFSESGAELLKGGGDASAKEASNFRVLLGSPLDERYTFDNYVVGKSNELAHAAAQRVADAENVTFNPLFLYGGVGLGKTHLMHAIAWHIQIKHPQRRVIYLSAEKFMYQFIRALRYRDTVAFKEQFRSVDVLMIDDVQFISGKDSTQEEFFHTFNALVDRNRQIIISADKSPSDLEGMEDRLKSRLGWGLVADIHPTTYELRLGILQAKADQAEVPIDPSVLEFLAHKITSNVRELEGALNRVVAHAMLVGREITLEMTQDALRDLIRANDRRISVDDIQKKVAEHFNIRLSDMQSSRRVRTIARPRQIAMYLSKQLTSNSLPEIGRKFGGRDHTTVMHAVKTVEKLLDQEADIREDVTLLKRMLES